MQRMIRLTITIILLAVLFSSYAISAEFWGSKNSNKYHYPSCGHARGIKPENIIIFNSTEDAVKANYIPCKVCKPPLASTAEGAAKSAVAGGTKLPLSPASGGRFYSCTRVVDGDTIVVNIAGKIEKVRLIGVDTPETVHPQKPVERFGKEASEFTRRMVAGKTVRLEYDWQTRDKYGRLLGYVYLQDETFLNAEIIKQGYGFAYTKYPFKYLDDFRRYEREARENSRGLWKEK